MRVHMRLSVMRGAIETECCTTIDTTLTWIWRIAIGRSLNDNPIGTRNALTTLPASIFNSLTSLKYLYVLKSPDLPLQLLWFGVYVAEQRGP